MLHLGPPPNQIKKIKVNESETLAAIENRIKVMAPEFGGVFGRYKVLNKNRKHEEQSFYKEVVNSYNEDKSSDKTIKEHWDKIFKEKYFESYISIGKEFKKLQHQVEYPKFHRMDHDQSISNN